jgi:hypothetical protein
MHQRRFDRALERLRDGDYAGGWADYESRKYRANWSMQALGKPEWDGRPIPDRTLLIVNEQGAGDEIQFIRFVPLAAQRAGRVVLVCRPALRAIFDGLEGVSALCCEGEPLPDSDYDYVISTLSLPHRLGITLDNLPAHVPYLSAPPARIQHWKSRLPAVPGKRRIGIAWAGSPGHPLDRERSMQLSDLIPLLRDADSIFHSLQMGFPSAELTKLPADIVVRDESDRIENFAETAALIANLDLVISVDTAVAHLAGAMAKPVWVLLPRDSDWRWLKNRSDSPWYPTLRLFRQPARGDWAGVINKVLEELKQLPVTPN